MCSTHVLSQTQIPLYIYTYTSFQTIITKNTRNDVKRIAQIHRNETNKKKRKKYYSSFTSQAGACSFVSVVYLWLLLKILAFAL